MTALDVVQRQLDAYNARDLEAFAACFAEGITMWRLPAATPAIANKAELRAFYGTQRFTRPGLRAVLLGRLLLGDKVFDHERIFGIADEPIETVVVYEVRDGLIVTSWAFAPGAR